jgi:hypothetical protein
MKYGVPRKRRRWKLIALGAFVAAVIGWHFVPAWRKHVLDSAVEVLQVYRSAHGRYPISQAELDAALDQGALARRGCYVKYDLGPNWDTTTVIYRPFEDGRSFELRFNHHCFCDFGDTSRYATCSSSDGKRDEWTETCD